MRFVVIPSTVFFHNGRTATPKISWRVVDVDAGLTPMKYPKKTVATCNDQTTADRIAAHLNGGTRFDEIAWQGCLDHANKNAATARADADRVRNQLFEACEQRDEARADARNAWAELKKQPNGGFWTGSVTVYNEHREPETIVSILDRVQKAEAGEIKMRLEAARALTENAELRKALEASHREIAEARHYWANQGPHDHVVISLDGYNKLVKQRDSAVAERDALENELTQVCSYIDGKWVRTS